MSPIPTIYEVALKTTNINMKPIYIALLAGLFTGLTDIYAYTPVTVPNGNKLAYSMVKGVKEFQLTIDDIDYEFAPGMHIKTWGYNGQTPGPVIEGIEGDRIRILVTNKRKDPTVVHWHGLFLPNEMDGVQGLTQQGIAAGETFSYEFRLKQHGTFMYYSPPTETDKAGRGAMGFLISHPEEETHRIDKDFVIFLNDWVLPNKTTAAPIFTLNGKVYPETDPLVVQTGERVRIRFANIGQSAQPIHLHGYSFKVVATDGGDIPILGQWPETTVVISPGQSRDIEFLANLSGDWAIEKKGAYFPTSGEGPLGKIQTGGIMTILKVRDRSNSKTKSGWYAKPKSSGSEALTE